MGMPPIAGRDTANGRPGHTMGGGYVHRKHSEAEGHRRHNNRS